MKAMLKINYGFEKKGSIHKIVEILNNKIICLEINGKKVDFGFSEVQIIAPSKSDLFELGRFLIMYSKKVVLFREKDINNAIKTITLPITKTLMKKSISYAIWQ